MTELEQMGARAKEAARVLAREGAKKSAALFAVAEALTARQEEILEQKQLREEVYAALMKLPAIQARRIYARFYLGMTVAEIAQIEGTDRRRVWSSIQRGLKKLARLLDTAQ